jgi:hypothetical protein
MYTESMPQISGIGLTPLLQWLVVPLVALYFSAVREFSKGRQADFVM